MQGSCLIPCAYHLTTNDLLLDYQVDLALWFLTEKGPDFVQPMQLFIRHPQISRPLCCQVHYIIDSTGMGTQQRPIFHDYFYFYLVCLLGFKELWSES